MTKFAVLATTAFLAAVSPAFAGTLNGLAANALNDNALNDNGLAANALNDNALNDNGLAANALNDNGIRANGIRVNGLSLGGVDGMKVIGIELAR